MSDLFQCPKCRKLTLKFDATRELMTCFNPNCDMMMIPQDESNLWYIEK